MQQIPLSLHLTPSYKPDDYIAGRANHGALQWLAAWPDWPQPYRALNISGPSGCGKTHLSYVFGQRSGAHRLMELHDISEIASLTARHFILDDFTLTERFSQEAMFHFFNHLASTGGTALLLSQQSVAQMDTRLADLRSRLRSIACQEIASPEDDLLKQVLQKMFADRQCSVPDATIHYMVTRMERNFTTAYHLVAEIDQAALSAKKPVTLAIVKSVMMPDNDALEFDFKHGNKEI
jgi:chromosomal replication initiation ATPase DnaA